MFRKFVSKKIEIVTGLAILIIALFVLLASVNIYKSYKIIEGQINANFISFVDELQESEDNYFKSVEEEVYRCKSLIEITIDSQKLNQIAPKAYNYDKDKIPYVQNYLDEIVSPLFIHSKNNIKSLMSIYLNFDYNFINHKDIIGLWYADTNQDKKIVLMDNGPITNLMPKDKATLQWFYLPQKMRKGVWDKTYWDEDLKINTLTYSAPIYVDKKFIGIVGIDLSMDEIKKELSNIKIYKTGKAYLIDSQNKIIYGKGHKTFASAEDIDKNLYKFLTNLNLKNPEIKLIKAPLSKKLFAVTPLCNGYILVIEASTEELYAEVHKLIAFTAYSLLLTIIISVIVGIKAYIEVKRINQELFHKEKLISMGKMAAEVAHEINNPINFINCNLDTLKKFVDKLKQLIAHYEEVLVKVLAHKTALENEMDGISDLKEKLKIDYVLESLDELIEESKEGIKRVSEIVVNLKIYSEDDRKETKTEENLEKILNNAFTILGSKIKTDVQVIKDFEAIPPVLCNKNQLEQVFINILDNANFSLEQKDFSNKKIKVSVYKKGKNAYIEIADNGTGIDKSDLNKIFDTFYTTKDSGEGTGLGLSIAYEIITKKHKGEISVESKKGKGTKFTIKLPY